MNGISLSIASLILLIPAVSTAPAATLAEVNARLTSGQTTRIVCFGDSITGAYYHTGGVRAWCDMLGLALQKTHPRADLQMINAGISGHTTVHALKRMEKDVLARKPHLVVVMFGMNDVVRMPLSDYRANLRKIAEDCLKSGAAVVLCTPNGVSENPARPESRLAEFAQVVHEVGTDLQLPVADCFRHWIDLREADPTAWALLMSDAIHPNMTGHIEFAELIAEVITQKAVTLDGTAVPHDALHHTFDQLSEGKPVKLVAMPPYDTMLPELLKQHFPDAEFNVTTWPTDGQSVTRLAAWAQRIRGQQPDLVVPAVPAETTADSQDIFIRDYEWVLNYSFQFAGRPWDVVPVLATVAGKPKDAQRTNLTLARKIITGKDVAFVERAADDDRTPRDLVAAWIADQKRVWQGARNRLPETNDAVYVPAQTWPWQPGPRTVRVSIHYPDGQLAQVSEQTGIMLSLHNWGGQHSSGTANPDVLANRLNVVAVCVDYLQSGRKASVESPEPYDFGYLQALDALRALWFVRSGLTRADKSWDDGRLFCTGGSGGGNVTLMANKLAPRTFACIIDKCGMKKLSDDIAFNLPGGSRLNARWSRDPESTSYLTADAQAIRFVGHPAHLTTMKQLNPTARIIVVHGVDDATCPFADAEELVANLQAADLPAEPHFITKDDLDGTVFTSTGHALGDRTEIVFRVAGHYLDADSPDALKRSGPTDFDRREDLRYLTQHGAFVISYRNGYPEASFEPAADH
ncbi:MAG: GDSL-type esterase/lipase family protein [Fuerstiella sp.]